jgi:hypothetical protein
MLMLILLTLAALLLSPLLEILPSPSTLPCDPYLLTIYLNLLGLNVLP